MSATSTAMEVNAEARRILAVSISKLYASRTQRGGLRLHRSLLVSLVMRSARDIYHASRESEAPGAPTPQEPMDSSPSSEEQKQLPPQEAEPAQTEPECALSPAPQTAVEAEECACDSEITEDKENMSPAARQSRKRRSKASAAPDFLPSKRARLEPGEERYAAPLGSCRVGAAETLSALSLNLVIPAC